MAKADKNDGFHGLQRNEFGIFKGIYLRKLYSQ
jgi:hypothetical protein